MGPKEEPTFYLYGIGYHPDHLTLGTLIYGNYAQPDIRFITFPKLSDDELVKQDLIFQSPIGGTFTTKSNRKFGFGIEALEVGNIGIEFARSRSKIIMAKSGRRITLKRPETFFLQRVIQSPAICDVLQTWLTLAPSAYLRRRFTFRKPKIFCVTGIYELEDVRAKTDHTSSHFIDGGISSAIIAAATAVPVGGTLGPFENGETITADIFMPGTSIWAARFNQLDAEYVKAAAEGRPVLAATIRLRPDVTLPGEGVMAGGDESEAAVLRMRTEEMPEEVEDSDEEYWPAFEKARERLTEWGDAEEEDV